jgi:hypothetical protein
LAGLLLAAGSAVTGAACGRGSPELPVVPPPTAPLSREFIGYGVVVSYAYAVDRPGGGGASLGYFRRGSVAPVLERRLLAGPGNGVSWVLVGGAYRGWLREEVIQLYDNEAQARTAAESLLR